MRFDESIDVAQVLSDLASKQIGGKLNRPLRLPISAAVELVIDGRSIPAHVKDVSQRGIKIATSSVRSGEELIVQLEGLAPRKAVVRWTQTGMAGLNLVRSLSLDELARWVVQQQLSGEVAAAA